MRMASELTSAAGPFVVVDESHSLRGVQKRTSPNMQVPDAHHGALDHPRQLSAIRVVATVT